MQCIAMYASACIRSYLKSVLRNKFLIFDTYHPDTLYLHEQIREDPWLFLEPQGVREQNVRETLDYILSQLSEDCCIHFTVFLYLMSYV